MARVQEIVGRGALRAETTVTSLLNELDDILAGARGDRQWSAARSVIDTKARLKGLFVDRLEVGQPGEFAGLDSLEAIAKRAYDEHNGDVTAYLEAHDAVREAVVAYAANRAKTIPALVNGAGKSLRDTVSAERSTRS